MTIDTEHLVDTDLALVPIEDLMARAYELTHRIHGLTRDEDRSPKARTAVKAARDERDAVSREIKRRSDGFERSLVALDAADRLLRRVHANAGAIEVAPENIEHIKGRIAEIAHLAYEGTSITGSTWCSLVKSLRFADRLSTKGRETARPILRAARALRTDG